MATWGLATAFNMIQSAYEEKQAKKLNAKLEAEKGPEYIANRMKEYESYASSLKWYQTPIAYHNWKNE